MAIQNCSSKKFKKAIPTSMFMGPGLYGLTIRRHQKRIID
jgi:hypothetical protein